MPGLAQLFLWGAGNVPAVAHCSNQETLEGRGFVEISAAASQLDAASGIEKVAPYVWDRIT